MSIQLIVGLQNPGSAYEQTRHNAGAWFIEALLKAYPAIMKTEAKLHGSIGSVNIGTHPCRILLPTTFMNNSGRAVQATAHYYDIPPENILIVHDELDLLPGRIKLKSGGGNGGHNGLKDIQHQLKTDVFHRIRVGIGHPGDKSRVLDYVLNKPSAVDKNLIEDAIARSLAHIELVVEKTDLQRAMSLINL